MKKFLAMLLVLIMVFSLCACGKQSSDEEKDNTPVEQVEEVKPTAGESGGEISSIEAIGDVDVDNGLFNVTLSIPADFVDAEKTQADYDAMIQEKGYKSITLNEDGSLTYVMTKSQHKGLMAEMRTSFEESLDEMVGSEDYPNFVGIKANELFTEFKITTKSEELDLAESFSVLAFYMMSGMYNIFNGTEVDNCKVTFINERSGEVISESNSSEMGETSN